MKIKSLLILPVIVCTAYTCFEIYKKIKNIVDELKRDKLLMENEVENLKRNQTAYSYKYGEITLQELVKKLKL